MTTEDSGLVAAKAAVALNRLARDPAYRAAFNAFRMPTRPKGTPLERARIYMEQAFPGFCALWDKRWPEVEAEMKRKAALRTFRRALRRHEKRARLRSSRQAATYLREMRVWVEAHPDLGFYTGGAERDLAASLRRAFRGDRRRRIEAYLYERAAAAVVRLLNATPGATQR